jgi:hypothetical protein
MTPAKEKAKELVDKYKLPTRKWNSFLEEDEDDEEAAKACATICVDEILESHNYPMNNYPDKMVAGDQLIGGKNYWKEVKTEIQAL